MHKVCLLIIMALIVSNSAFSADTIKWHKFEANGFVAEFPQTPTIESQKVNSDIGELQMQIYTYDASANEQEDNLVYGVIYTEYPDSVINSDMVEILPEFFRNSIDGALNNVKGKLLSEKDIKIDKYPGREVRVDYDSGTAIIRMRFYLVKNKMYVIQTITFTAKEDNKSITRFLDSFQLVEQGKTRTNSKKKQSK